MLDYDLLVMYEHSSLLMLDYTTCLTCMSTCCVLLDNLTCLTCISTCCALLDYDLFPWPISPPLSAPLSAPPWCVTPQTQLPTELLGSRRGQGQLWIGEQGSRGASGGDRWSWGAGGARGDSRGASWGWERRLAGELDTLGSRRDISSWGAGVGEVLGRTWEAPWRR